MKEIFNIFHKREQKRIPEKRQKIIADYREKNCLVTSELFLLGIDVEFKNLKVGDYLIKDAIIERKTVDDFISSMINKRLIRQLQELQQYENRLLLIEGIEEKELYTEEKNFGVNANAIRGFLLSISLKYKVPIIFSKDYKDSAKFIAILSKKIEKEPSLNAKKKVMNKKEQLQFILEGFPGIGPKSAKKILENFKTIKNVANASEEELEKIIGKKARIMKEIVERIY